MLQFFSAELMLAYLFGILVLASLAIVVFGPRRGFPQLPVVSPPHEGEVPHIELGTARATRPRPKTAGSEHRSRVIAAKERHKLRLITMGQDKARVKASKGRPTRMRLLEDIHAERPRPARPVDET